MVHKVKQMQKDIGHLSLYSIFDIGDRVKKKHIDNSGNKFIYEGIILTITSDFIQIFWDTCDGKYSPYDLDESFSKITKDEIFNGNNENSPIKKLNNK